MTMPQGSKAWLFFSNVSDAKDEKTNSSRDSTGIGHIKDQHHFVLIWGEMGNAL